MWGKKQKQNIVLIYLEKATTADIVSGSLVG